MADVFRCIAFRTDTGYRCTRTVHYRNQHLCLCREHGKALFVRLQLESTTLMQRREWSIGKWEHVSEIGGRQ